MPTKICNKCLEAKPATAVFFYVTKTGFRSPCIACCSERHRLWQRRNKAKVLGYNKRNKAGRRKKDPLFALSDAISRGVRRSIETGKNGNSWERVVGYTGQDLVAHLERQFVGTMSWNNYGTCWHVDHIVPLCKFFFASTDDPEFKAAWALSNLRPLGKLANLQKSGKRLHLL